jgi:hypothetical protein
MNLGNIWKLSILLALAFGCGTWVGNPKEEEEEGEDPTQVVSTPIATGPGTTFKYQAQPGSAFMQKISAKAGDQLAVSVLFSASSSLRLASGSNSLEVSLVDSAGIEEVYQRSANATVDAKYSVPVDTDFTVLVRNSGDQPLDLEGVSISGGTVVGSLIDPTKRSDAPHKDLFLKAVVSFAASCKYLNSDGNTAEVTAPQGFYFVQPFVFYGKVAADQTVTRLDSAQIAVLAGSTTVPLRQLHELPLSAYKLAPASMSEVEHQNYTETFYRGYFGGEGALYTVETFRFGGDCSSAQMVELGEQPGQVEVLLQVQDASQSLDARYVIRPTLATAYSTYDGDGARITDWTQCTIDRLTGEPKTYNGSAAECKKFSFAKPPFVKLDYKLPSGTPGIDAVNDPTRLHSYGHAHPKAWYKALIADADALIAGEKTSIALPGCFVAGGLLAVPMQEKETHYPLKEFNTTTGDVINLGRRAGSFTALTGFYQGSVKSAASLQVPTCVPKDGDACYGWKTLKVAQSCRTRAESGISALAVGQNFIYPEYFEISGELVP